MVAYDESSIVDADGVRRYDEPTDCKMADIDGDGDLDVLAHNKGYYFIGYEMENGKANAMLINDGGGNFDGDLDGDGYNDYGFGNGGGRLCVVDIDGDGDLDVLVTNDELGCTEYPEYPENCNNAMFINDGVGNILQVMVGVFVTDGGSSRDLEVVDIDGDGDLDIIVANSGGANNAMYINDDGRGDFRKVTVGDFVTDGGMSSSDLEVVDIDGDGDLDILVANYNQNNAMYINHGCPAGAARLSSGASWCFDCPTFTTQKVLGDGAPQALRLEPFCCQAP
jgi:hypothetical protein